MSGRAPGAAVASHECPGRGCKQRVGTGMLACRPHWYMIPKPLRVAVWAAWRDGAGAGSPEHTAAITAAVKALNTKLGGPASTVILTASQSDCFTDMLADAISYREPAGQCNDCDEHPASLCGEHAADLDRTDAYLALARDLGIGVPR